MKAEADIPVLTGSATRRWLVKNFGLPNAWPRDGETPWQTERQLFVDDDDGGRSVAFWVPDESEHQG